MKRICIIGFLLVCMVLTSCRATTDFKNLIEILDAPTGETTTTSEPDSNTKTSSTTKTTTGSTAKSTKKSTTKTTKNSSSGIVYKDVDPYSLPVANPDKGIYNTPDGNRIGAFNTIGYYTVVEEASDTKGRTWGRLSTGEGWTLIYFEVLPELEMWFGSGVGAWGTSLSITGKGEFSGVYHDSEAGDADDAYPNGTCYICDFEGAFAITDIGTYTVSLKMTSLTSKQKAATEWIEDGIRYIASAAYGLEGQTEFLLYLPNTPVSALPEDAYGWSCPELGDNTIDCYALYGPETGFTFFD